jgi:hypothetical protein
VTDPTGELAAEFSSAGAAPTPWPQAQALLEHADGYWLVTVRPDGRPHTTPLISVWLDGALHFCTGPQERKTKNIADNDQVLILTGCNTLSQDIDVVMEGNARRVLDEQTLQRLADIYASKYGDPFLFKVDDDAFLNEAGGEALVFGIVPKKAFAFAKGDSFSQTRWRF